ncbi:MAG: class I SAM-dependent methyltransferase [Thermodesulfovibrionales bacterium]
MPSFFESKKDFKNHYDDEAERYDAARIDTPDGAWVTDREVNFVRENLQLKPGSKILEAGCGTGRILVPLAKTGLQCFGIDPAQNMLSILLTKSSDGALRDHVCVGDIENIPFCNDTFDGVYTINVLQWLPDGYEKSFTEMYRVAKKGARIIMDFPNRYSFWKCLKMPLMLIMRSARVSNKTFTLGELRKSFDHLCNGHYVIKSQFSYPKKFYKYLFIRNIVTLFEKLLPLPFHFRGKFYVIVTKK